MSIAGLGLVLAAAQANAGTEAGKFELTASVADTAEVVGNNSGLNSVDATLGFGYFLTSAIEVKGNVIGVWSTGKGSSNTLLYFLVGPDYNFNLGADSKLVPYVGAYGGGVYYGPSSGSSSFFPAFDAHLGLKYFVTERTSINAQVSYQEYFGNSTTGDVGSVITSIGISYFF